MFKLNIFQHKSIRLLYTDPIFKGLLREKAYLPKCLPELFLKAIPTGIYIKSEE